MKNENYYRVSIKGTVIDRDGRILLAREDNGKWELLGGGLNHNEDPADCLKREIREETGLEVTYISERPVYFVTSRREGADTFIANVVYEIKLKDMNFTPSDECHELRFFSTKEMREIKLFPNVQKLLEVIEEQNA